MFTEDYIVRMIRQATAALATALGLAKTGQFQAAHQLIDQTMESVVGLSASIVKVMDDQGLLNLLTAQENLDVQRTVAVADIFKAEGDICVAQNHARQGAESYTRALALYLEAALHDPSGSDGELTAKIAALHQQLANAQLPAETLSRLRDFYAQ